MSVTVTDNRTPLNEADATTNWTGAPTLFTSDPDPVEATGHIGYVVSSATVDAYVTISSTSFTDKLVYAWALPLGAMDTLANGGVAIVVGDGTNRVAYHLAGADVAAFRHNTGQPIYQCLVLDQASLPAAKTVRAGAEGSLDWAAITQVGVMFKTLAKSKGGSQNCWVDIIRLLDPAANNGCALTITGGTEGDPGTFAEIAAEDAAITTTKAHGAVRELGAGAYGVQAPLRFGDADGSSSTWFEDKNVSVIFESRGMTATRYKIFIADNGTGTATFKLGTKVGTGAEATGKDSVVITAAPGVGWEFDAATDADVTDVFIYGSTFNGATGGVKLRTGHEFIGGVISNSGTVEANGATMVNTSIVGCLAASALLWDVNSDTNGKLNGMSFSMGASGHAIELGPDCPDTIGLTDVSFLGYGANDTTDAALYNNSGKAITIDRSGGTSVTVRNGSGSSTVVNEAVSLTITANVSLVGAEIRIYDLDTTPPDYGTELAGVESHDAATYAYSGGAGNVISVQIMLDGFVEFNLETTMPAVNSTLPIVLTKDLNA